MKKVLFIVLGFEHTEDGGLYSDLIKEFRDHGHQVTVLAPSIDDEQNVVEQNNIKVIRTKTPKLFNIGKFAKGISNILLPHLYKRALKLSGVPLDFDLILMPTPTITQEPLVRWIKNKSGAKFCLILRDIFPQNAIDLGMMKEGSLTHRYFRNLEHKLYAISDHIGCMSQANIDYVIKHNPEVATEKLFLLPNWMRKVKNEAPVDLKEIRKKYALEDKFVLIFGGNLGEPQKVDYLVEAAASMQEFRDIVFLVIGTGTEKERISKMSEEMKLENFIMMDKLPRPDYLALLETADIGLISLNKCFTIPNFPSRLCAYFATGIPVIATTDINTDIGVFVEDVEAGAWSEGGDTEALKTNILKYYNHPDLLRKHGANGYDYYMNNLLPGHTYERIMNRVNDKPLQKNHVSKVH
ncbi:glycosyltransferase family 4 protein [Robertkochia solimangrovi]|uniref:glycosyltransferase family 4 protein n=1 Tax=Robertkochia solimangrovi TaxID=2213046 RepID=UPI00117D0CD3|nr:glycosyltransferase family 4 protein [Robertkochia solimangrovi]TRZ45009.1 glycosyltransferase WbuB [Robertkochia solimangrovi]